MKPPLPSRICAPPGPDDPSPRARHSRRRNPRPSPSPGSARPGQAHPAGGRRSHRARFPERRAGGRRLLRHCRRKMGSRRLNPANAKVDLVLLDLNMPVKNGWDTFEQLTREHPLISIIIVTARPNQLFTAARRRGGGSAGEADGHPDAVANDGNTARGNPPSNAWRAAPGRRRNSTTIRRRRARQIAPTTNNRPPAKRDFHEPAHAPPMLLVHQ